MNKPTRTIEWLVWGALVLIIVVIAVAVPFSKHRLQPLPVIGQLSDFNLTNQDGKAISLASLRGKVWAADIIFTRCGGPCPKLTHQFAGLQKVLPANLPLELISLTSDPEFDTPPVLKKYATRFGADTNHWNFLTGPKAEIRRLAINDFKFVVVEKKEPEREAPEDLFIHSTWFVLVDKQGRVRGWNDAEGHLHAYFDSEEPAVQTQILNAAERLLNE